MKCRCCGSEKLDLVLDLGDQPWGNNFISIKSEEKAKNYPLKLFFVVIARCYSLTMQYLRKKCSLNIPIYLVQRVL